MITEPVVCVECTRIIQPGDDASTFCGSIHEEGCLENHKRHCRVCDEDGEYTHDGAAETTHRPTEHTRCLT